MNRVAGLMVSLACFAFVAPVFADPPEGRGYKKHQRHEYKEEYWDGDCKIERKYERNGNYKEERKCERAPSRSPAYVYAPPPPPVEAEVVVRPPTVVIEAPSVVVSPPRVTIR